MHSISFKLIIILLVFAISTKALFLIFFLIPLIVFLKIKDKSEIDTLMNREEYDKFAKESSN